MRMARMRHGHAGARRARPAELADASLGQVGDCGTLRMPAFYACMAVLVLRLESGSAAPARWPPRLAVAGSPLPWLAAHGHVPAASRRPGRC